MQTIKKYKHIILLILLVLSLHSWFTQITFSELYAVKESPLFKTLKLKIYSHNIFRTDDTYIGAPLHHLFSGEFLKSFVLDGGFTPYIGFGSIEHNQRNQAFSLYNAGFWFFGPQTGRNYLYFLVLMTGVVGMYLLSGFLTESRTARLSMGVSYGFSAHFMVWLVGAHSIALTGSLIPILIYGVIQIFERQKLRDLALFVWASWEFIQAHYPPSQIIAAYFIMVVLSIYLLSRLIEQRKNNQIISRIIKPSGLFLSLAIFAVIASVLVWFPRVEFLKNTQIAERVYSPFGFQAILNSDLLLLSVFPRFFGAGTYWNYAANTCEMAYGVNAIIAGFALLSIFRLPWELSKIRRLIHEMSTAQKTLWVSAGISLWILTGIFFNRGIFPLSFLPFMNNFNPRRIFLLCSWGLVLLGGLEISRMLKNPGHPRYVIAGFFALSLSTAMLMIWGLFKQNPPFAYPEDVLIGLLGFSFICLTAYFKGNSRYLNVAIVGVVFVVSVFWVLEFTPRVSQFKVDNMHPVIKRLKHELKDDFFYVVFGDQTATWNLAGFFGIPTLDEYDLIGEKTQQWFGALSGTPVSPNPGGIIFTTDPTQQLLNNNLFQLGRNTRLLEHFNVKYVLLRTPLENPDFELSEKYNDIWLYRFKHYRPRIYAPSSVEILTDLQWTDQLASYQHEVKDPRVLVKQSELGKENINSCPEVFTWKPDNLGEGDLNFEQPVAEDCFLFVAAKYSINYEFEGDADAIQKISANDLFTGLVIPAGTKTFSMEYVHEDYRRFGLFWLIGTAGILGIIWQLRKKGWEW
ncbi:MAG: hypothetical protein HQM11_09180 [SAR324 cluster bacterium]|nr:hypothetical protein [SAR324 cluster bacterium]